jgi:hypothetical protein
MAMLKFNKKGKKVMEINDNGDIKITNEQFADKLRDFIEREEVEVDIDKEEDSEE